MLTPFAWSSGFYPPPCYQRLITTDGVNADIAGANIRYSGTAACGVMPGTQKNGGPKTFPSGNDYRVTAYCQTKVPNEPSTLVLLLAISKCFSFYYDAQRLYSAHEERQNRLVAAPPTTSAESFAKIKLINGSFYPDQMSVTPDNNKFINTSKVMPGFPTGSCHHQ
jgi:hypothetical protein